MDPVTLPPMPTQVTPERGPNTAKAIDAMLDAANPSYRRDFICSTYVVYRGEGDECAIVQVSPQQRTADPSAPGGTDDNISTGGFVGSGGWRPEDVSDPGNGPENR